MIIYTVHIYYSKHGTSDEENFQISYNCCYDKGMTSQRKPIPHVLPPKKTR